ncbi:hypothetical protein ACFSQ7_10060 [Paenibacillus rhizoplanae]
MLRPEPVSTLRASISPGKPLLCEYRQDRIRTFTAGSREHRTGAKKAMAWWIWAFNIIVIVLLVLRFARLKLNWMGRGVLLAPILIYALISAEDLLNLIDLGTIVPGNRGLRGLILFFCPGFSPVLYSVYIP